MIISMGFNTKEKLQALAESRLSKGVLIFNMKIIQISEEELYHLIRKAVRAVLIEILNEVEPTEDEIKAYADALREIKEKN